MACCSPSDVVNAVVIGICRCNPALSLPPPFPDLMAGLKKADPVVRDGPTIVVDVLCATSWIDGFNRVDTALSTRPLFTTSSSSSSKSSSSSSSSSSSISASGSFLSSLVAIIVDGGGNISSFVPSIAVRINWHRSDTYFINNGGGGRDDDVLWWMMDIKYDSDILVVVEVVVLLPVIWIL